LILPTPSETRTKLVEQIMDAQQHIHKAFHRQMRHLMSGLPVTPPKLPVLGLINRHPGLTVSELARQFRGAKSNISETVEHLCREGLLEKRADAADQRLARIHLTESGQKILEKLWARHVACARDMLTALSDEQLAGVAQNLELLAQALDNNCGGRD